MQYRGDYYVTGDRAKRMRKAIFGLKDEMMILSSVLAIQLDRLKWKMLLLRHPYVKECAVVASPDHDRGNIVKAFVVLKDGIKENEKDLVKMLQNHVKEMTAPYKYPRKIEFVSELTKNIFRKNPSN